MTPPKIAPAALADAIGHLYTDAVREVGGFFVGSITDGVVAIDASIPALAAKGSEVNLTFGHEVWTDTMALVDRDYAGMQIVGWFHSHPGHGVFLSGYDEFIQTNFFPGDGMVAYVLDPHDDVAGWFETRAGRIEALGVGPVDRPAGAALTSAELAQSRDRRGRGVLIGALVVVAGFIGGYVVANATQPGDRTDTERVGILEQDLADAQARASAAEGKVAAIETYLATAATNAAASTYVIQPGDSLWGISEARLGSGERWQEVYDVNATAIGPLGAGGTLPRSAIGVRITIPAK